MKTKTLRIELAFPPKELNPNKRIEIHRKNSIFQNYKMLAKARTRYATHLRHIKPSTHRQKYPLVNIQYIVFPPDYRRRDEDNFIASMKAAQDGIAEALGVNDCFFHLQEIIHRPKTPDGKVIAVVSWSEGGSNE